MLLRNPYTHDTRVEKEARTLRDAGYEVTVVAHAARGLPRRERRDGVEVRRIPRPFARVPLARFAAHARALRRELAALRPDVIHAHDSDALGPAATAARDVGVPFVHDAHELWLGRPPRGRSTLYRLAYTGWYRRLERREVPRAAAVIAVSSPIAAFLEREYGVRDVALVPNYPELPPNIAAGDIRQLPGGDAIPVGAPVALHLGGYQPDRGLEQVLSAVADVPDVHLALLGIGPRGSPLDELARRLHIARRVHFMAPVASDDVIAFAASASLGLVPILPTTPNNAASMPNKLFQYMAAGLPVVSTDLPHLREIVEGSGAGRCVDSSRPEALAAAMRSILADPALAAAMGSAGRGAVAERYNWSVAAATLLRVYERISSGAPLQSPR